MKTIIIILLAAGILYTTNPDSDDFSDHIRDRIQERIEKESDVGSKLGELGAGITAILAENVTTRKDYLLFSTYEIMLDEEEDARWKYVGIASQFVQLDAPNEDEEN